MSRSFPLSALDLVRVLGFEPERFGSVGSTAMVVLLVLALASVVYGLWLKQADATVELWRRWKERRPPRPPSDGEDP